MVFRSGKQQRAKMKANRHIVEANRNAVVDDSEIVTHASHAFRMQGSSKEGADAMYTVFHNQEATYEVDKRVALCRKPFTRRECRARGDMYREAAPMPLRAAWSPRMSKDDVDANEEAQFEAFLSTLYRMYPPERINHFEHNIQVWRQLWRVCEKSDVLVLVADARHPLFHFPPALYNFVVKLLQKPFVMVLNKVDLVRAEAVHAWIDYFARNYPGVRVIPFTSYPHADSMTMSEEDARKKRVDRKITVNTRTRPCGLTELKAALREMGYDWQVAAAAEVAERRARGDVDVDAEQRVFGDEANYGTTIDVATASAAATAAVTAADVSTDDVATTTTTTTTAAMADDAMEATATAAIAGAEAETVVVNGKVLTALTTAPSLETAAAAATAAATTSADAGDDVNSDDDFMDSVATRKKQRGKKGKQVCVYNPCLFVYTTHVYSARVRLFCVVLFGMRSLRANGLFCFVFVFVLWKMTITTYFRTRVYESNMFSLVQYSDSSTRSFSHASSSPLPRRGCSKPLVSRLLRLSFMCAPAFSIC
jgi:hypothetical protein